MTEPKLYEGRAIDGPLHGKWIRSRDFFYRVDLKAPTFAFDPIATYTLWRDGIWRLDENSIENFIDWKQAGNTEYTEPNKL